MKRQEVIHGLQDLVDDRKSFLTNDGDDEIYWHDIQVLNAAISHLEEKEDEPADQETVPTPAVKKRNWILYALAVVQTKLFN